MTPGGALALAACGVLLAGCGSDAAPEPRAAASPRPSPAPSYSHPPLVDDCDVLCVSDAEVSPGQMIEVTFDPPRRLIWGVLSEVWRVDEEPPGFVASLYGWQDKDEKLTTFWPGTGGGEDVGFYGPGSWQWRVPRRLEPGTYQIRKEAIGQGVRRPIEDRTTTWSVDFEVVS